MAATTRAKSKAAEAEDFTEDANVQVIPFKSMGRTADREGNKGQGKKYKFGPDEADGTYLVGTLYIPVATIEKYGEPTITVHVEFPE